MIRIVSILSLFFFANCRQKDQSEIVAKIDNEVISYEQIDNIISDPLYESLYEIYYKRQIALNELINERLIQKELSIRHIDRVTLFELEVLKRAQKVSIDSFVKVNSLTGGIPSPKNSLKYLSIYSKEGIEELRRVIERKLTDDFIQKLRVKYNTTILLRPPKVPKKNLDGIEKEILGNLSSDITFTLVTNIDCPACSYYQPFFDSLYSRYSDKAKFEFINLTDLSSLKSVLSECAFSKGKYWEYMQSNYSNNGALDSAKMLIAYKAIVHDDFNSEDFDAIRNRITLRKEFLSNIGISNTPTILINNRIYYGPRTVQAISRFLMEERISD